MEIGVFNVHTTPNMVASARHVGNYSLGFLDLWHEEVCQEKVADMVCCKLALNSIFRLGEVSHCHDAGTIDESVDLACDLLDLVRRTSHRQVVEQVGLHEVSPNGGVNCFDFVNDRLYLAV